jgi:signal transduction histidine kinase
MLSPERRKWAGEQNWPLAAGTGEIDPEQTFETFAVNFLGAAFGRISAFFDGSLSDPLSIPPMIAATPLGRQRTADFRRSLAYGLGYVAVYVVLDWVSYIRPFSPLGFTPWNPQSGLTVAFLVRSRPMQALWLLPAAFLADLIVRGLPAPVGVTLLSAAVIGGGYALTAVVLKQVPLFDARIASLAAVIVLLGVALLSSAIVSALYVAVFAASGLLPWDDYPKAAFRHWVGDVIGIAVVTPLLLRASWDGARAVVSRLLENPVEIGAQLLSILLVVWIVFGLEDTDEFKFFYLLFLPVIWISLSHGLDGAALALVATQIGIIVAIEARQFSAGHVSEFQLLMLALGFTGLLIGSVVSDRRRVQARLRDSEARLREHQGELAQFARTSAVGQVASTLAHELSQPLSATATYIGACRRMLASPAADLSRIREAMAKAEAQAQRAGRVLSGLRDFLYRGESHLAPESAGSILESVRALTQAEVERSRTAFVLDDRSGGIRVLVDRIQIEQALLNLVRNALEAIGEAAAPVRQIEVVARHDDGTIEFDVADSGPGVPDDLVPDLFQPFVTNKARGMGLGLTISRSIVEAHGGRLWYEPRPGGGSLFRMTLPVASDDAR